MFVNKNKITKEMLEKVMKCKTPDELIALAKTEDIELTKDEAGAYLAELNNVELDNKELKRVAGGNGCPYRVCNWDCLKDDSYVNIV